MWFPNRSDTNRPVHAQKQDRSLNFGKQEEEVHYPCSENKGADQLRNFCNFTAKLICVIVFAYADCWFSHEATQTQKKTVRPCTK